MADGNSLPGYSSSDLYRAAAQYQVGAAPSGRIRKSLQKASTPEIVSAVRDALHSFGKSSACAELAEHQARGDGGSELHGSRPHSMRTLALAKFLLYCADLIAR